MMAGSRMTPGARTPRILDLRLTVSSRRAQVLNIDVVIGSYSESVVGSLRFLQMGLNPIEVSIQPPQEHPAPPSGIRSMPWAGMVFSQQLGRRRMKRDTDPVSLFQSPRGELPSPRIRNMRAFLTATTVEHPRRGP